MIHYWLNFVIVCESTIMPHEMGKKSEFLVCSVAKQWLIQTRLAHWKVMVHSTVTVMDQL